MSGAVRLVKEKNNKIDGFSKRKHPLRKFSRTPLVNASVTHHLMRFAEFAP